MSSCFNENTCEEIIKESNFFKEITIIDNLEKNCSIQVSELYTGLEFSIHLLGIMKQVKQILKIVSTSDELKSYLHKQLTVIINKRMNIFVIV